MSRFQDEYPELASFLLYFCDPPLEELTGPPGADVDGLDKLESEAIAEYMSSAEYRDDVLADWERLLASGAPRWAEIREHIDVYPLDLRDERGPAGVRSKIERVLALLKAA